MIRVSVVASLLILGASASASAGAGRDEPLRLAPSSPWHVNYAEDSCRLARRFGEGDGAVLLALDRYHPGDAFRLLLAGAPLEGARSTREARLRFGPAEGEQELDYFKGELGGQPALIFRTRMRIAPFGEAEEALRKRLERARQPHRFDPAKLDPARAEAVRYFSIDASGLPPIVLETGSLGEPFLALQRCNEELLTHWGIDVEKHRSLSREVAPAGNPARWLSTADYPGGPMRRGEQAIVNFRLIVDREGRVEECHIQQATQGDAFERAVCEAVVKRARFEPALDAEGNPIRSYYVNSVTFQMPR